MSTLRRVAGRLIYYLSSLPTLVRGIRNWPAVAAGCFGLSDRPFPVELRRDGIKLEARSALDVWIIKETCLDDQYDVARLRGIGRPVVLDIGAGLGEFAVMVARRDRGARVLAFEPAPDSFSLLERNLALNQVENVEAFPYAVTGTGGVVTIDVSSGKPAQYRSIAVAGADSSIPTAPAVSLDDVFRDSRLDRCDLLKMDCEGAEFDILFAASDETLRRIGTLCLEVHEGVTAHSRGDLERFLGTRGFLVRVVPSRAHADLCLMFARRTSGDRRAEA